MQIKEAKKEYQFQATIVFYANFHLKIQLLSGLINFPNITKTN